MKNLNEPTTGLEIDLLIREYKGEVVKIAIETNGVYHYPRNSQKSLGKDEIKRSLLEKQGFKIIVIPYYNWYIIENDSKAKFLQDVIENALI